MTKSTMRILAAFLLLALVPPPLAADQGASKAPDALAWHHEGLAALSGAANEAKSQRKRLLLGLSGGST